MNSIKCTQTYRDLLFQTPLLKELANNLKQRIFDNLDFNLFSIDKNEIVAKQDSICKRLYILLEGELRADTIDGSGDKILIEKIVAPRAFATPHLFGADNILPATFTASEECILLTASRESVFNLISEEPSLLRSFFNVSGNCNQCSTIRLKVLSQKSIRGRFCTFLTAHISPGSNLVCINHNQEELAGYLCVSRPALSKEINKMIKEGIIKRKRSIIEITDTEKLASYCMTK